MLAGQVALLDGAILGAVVVFAELAYGLNWWLYAILLGEIRRAYKLKNIEDKPPGMPHILQAWRSQYLT